MWQSFQSFWDQDTVTATLLFNLPFKIHVDLHASVIYYKILNIQILNIQKVYLEFSYCIMQKSNSIIMPFSDLPTEWFHLSNFY